MLLVTAVGALGARVENILSSTVSQNFGADLRQRSVYHAQLLSLR